MRKKIDEGEGTKKKMDELQLNFDRVDIEDFTEKLFIFLQEKSLLDPAITKDGTIIPKVLCTRYHRNENVSRSRYRRNENVSPIKHTFGALCILPIRWKYAINPLLWSIVLTETSLLTDVRRDWVIEKGLIGPASFRSIILDFIEEYMEKTQGVTNIYL